MNLKIISKGVEEKRDTEIISNLLIKENYKWNYLL
jgi:hypothetical protein